MPELPEVETVRRGLEAVAVGRRVDKVSVTGARTVRRYGAAALRKGLTGRTFTAALRRGKFMALMLDDGAALVVHLRMTGQMIHVTDPRRTPKVPHTHVVLGLDDGSELRFVDPRTFGEMFVSEVPEGADLPAELGALGRDPVVDGLTPKQLGAILAGRKAPLKSVLLDQRLVAGIGNIYADEICHRARVRPTRPAGSLSPKEVAAVARWTGKVLEEAIAMRGSTLRDAKYVDVEGESGGYQARHAVYGRAGQPCPRCGAEVRRTRVGGRSSFFCANCQV
ncbi:MAG TPA: bifunctional DNA-formamidopyrimidine glycosylase/DNA-(apurinic or apyrimidinic site) lyase [Acidimicrobiales bacterium]|nr:bifunctional DNA-formamidopyrimidine glycosylase/DNA-(apurinic or apyrimidinic site) lyase [Acidimicrobiales bacterium]